MLALLVSAGLAALYFSYDPANAVFFPRCPFKWITGLDCPGCGSQRAVHALLHGDIQSAADHNLLLLISLPFFAVHAGYYVRGALNGKFRSFRAMYHPAVPVTALVVIGLFWVLRNIPVGPLSYLGSSTYN